MTVADPESLVREEFDSPADASTEVLDVRDLGPPKPLKNTLETLVELGEDTVLIQLNDRAPQHLYPKLDDRGYHYETTEVDDVVVTAIWPR